ncbi:MAG: LysE family translocator [Candidatus Omnitrophica bacterium]|nr:LysE family translocator [Candidatus Omnitrophota bacterium]
MAALALVPDASAMAVVSRSLSGGFHRGLAVLLGILVGDIIFILLAVYGLSFIAETMAGVFLVIKGLGSLYLLWLGFVLWKTKPDADEINPAKTTSWGADFLCGLFITLGDPKAIFFYISFLPAFLDLTRITVTDIVVIMLTVTTALAVTKLGYAYLAEKTRTLFQSIKARKIMNRAAGSVMIVTGIILIVNI